jgi:hypothetical protein
MEATADSHHIIDVVAKLSSVGIIRVAHFQTEDTAADETVDHALRNTASNGNMETHSIHSITCVKEELPLELLLTC